MENFLFTLITELKNLGYLGILILFSIEIIPSEIILPLAGYWVYQGDFELLPTLIFCIIGSMFGPIIFYIIGRRGGRPLLLKYGKWFFVREKELMIADEFFSKYGPLVVLWGRFIPGIRTIVSVPAGISKMNGYHYIFYTLLGVIPTSSFYVFCAYKLGENLNHLKEYASKYIQMFIIIVVISIVIYFAIKFLKSKKRNRTSKRNKNTF